MASVAKSEIKFMLEEARVIMPGVQTILGFQLIAVFQQTFHTLAHPIQVIHLASLLCSALSLVAIGFIVTIHRLGYNHRLKQPASFLLLGTRALLLCMVLLMVGLSLDLYVVASMVEKGSYLPLWIAGLWTLITLAAWFVYPLLNRSQYPNPAAEANAARAVGLPGVIEG